MTSHQPADLERHLNQRIVEAEAMAEEYKKAALVQARLAEKAEQRIAELEDRLTHYEQVHVCHCSDDALDGKEQT